MLPRLLLTAALERSVNRLIAMDPDVGRLLEPLAGKTIAIALPPLGLEIVCCPNRRSVQFIEHLEGTPDTRISGSPTAMALMGLSGSSRGALFAGDVVIEGDTHVARRFQALIEQLDIDWEGQLAQFTGTEAAQRIGAVFRAGRDWARESLATLGLNTTEYLQEEIRQLPTDAEMEIYCEAVDALRADSDRLQARLERLQAAADDIAQSSAPTTDPSR